MRDIVETCDVTRNEAGGPQENLNATEGNDDLTIVTTENRLGTTLFALGGAEVSATRFFAGTEAQELVGAASAQTTDGIGKC